jgi:hypothetical protein
MRGKVDVNVHLTAIGLASPRKITDDGIAR